MAARTYDEVMVFEAGEDRPASCEHCGKLDYLLTDSLEWMGDDLVCAECREGITEEAEAAVWAAVEEMTALARRESDPIPVLNFDDMEPW